MESTTIDSAEDGRVRDVFDSEQFFDEERTFDEEEMFMDISPERCSARRSTRTRSEQFSNAHTSRLA